MLKRFLFLLLTVCTLWGWAQTKSISGKVTDAAKNPLPGVTVLIKGTSIGTTTDANGAFTIAVQPRQTLKFSFVGMKEMEVVYSGQPLLVSLSDDTKKIDEVVVIGYQTVKKADLTGAVAILKPETHKNAVVTGTVADALISVPGVYVRATGQPGGEGFVEIRGTATFGNSKPLYVIDGIAVEGGGNRDFNFNDVESVQVLKDASAAAIYGSRAANGVIIITTKKGKEGPMKIDISAKTTLQWLPRYNLTNREEWIKLNDLAFANAGRTPASHASGNTDWQDEVLKQGVIKDYNVGFSGGNGSSSYFISGNYQSNSGATIGTKSERFTFRSNTSSERHFGENVTFRIGENMILSNYAVDELNTNPIVDMWRMLPTIPVYDSKNSGGFGYGDGSKDVTFGTNPVAKENLTDTKNENLRIRGNAFTELEVFKSLKYRFNFGFESSNDQYMNLRKIGNWTYNMPYDPSSINKFKANSRSLVYDNTLEFNKSFGKHTVGAVAGTSFMDISYERLWGTKNNVLPNGNDYFTQLDAALSDPKTGSYKDLQKLFSVFGRVNYSYDDKYLFSATIRRDASSKFGNQYRNGVFPSVSGAWRISKEKFFNVPWVNDLKIRANYGVLGSSNIGVWDWVSFINLFPQSIFGTDQHIETGMTVVKLVNEDLKWEELAEMNAGFDAQLFRNRLSVSADYYIKTTRDVLTGMQILMSTGNNGGNPYVNAASLRNTGFEISLAWKDKIGEVGYGFGMSASTNKNEILKLGYGRTELTQWDTKSRVGHSIGDWFLIKTDGLFKSDTEVLAHVNSKGKLIQPNAKPGDIRYIDSNDDGMITDADRQYCGTSLPKVQLSMNGSVEYKGFDLMFEMRGSFGHKLFNGPRSGYDSFNDNSNYRADYDAWTPSNPNAKDPRPIYSDARNSRGDQDRWLEKGDYLRLSQLALGYTFPKWLRGEYIDQVRLFVNAQNLLTITKYKGLDPEFLNGNIWDRGYDPASYPTAKGLTFGAQITF
jgi:TonB-linked SusC/RagA family outer membrane protein